MKYFQIDPEQYYDYCIVSANCRQFCKVQVVGAVDVGYVGRKLRKVRNNLCLKPIWQSSSHLRGVQSHPALSHPMRTELGFFFTVNVLVWVCVSSSVCLRPTLNVEPFNSESWEDGFCILNSFLLVMVAGEPLQQPYLSVLLVLFDYVSYSKTVWNFMSCMSSFVSLIN